MRSGVRFTWRDLVTGLGLGLVVAIGCAKAATGLSEQEKRTACAANLRQIGDAISQYRSDNAGGLFPRTSFAFGPPVAPTWGTPYAADGKPGPIANADPFDAASPAAVAPADVTAALFLLVRTEGVKPAAFVCPSTDATPFDFGGGAHSAAEWTNWPGASGVRSHLSYALSNPYAGQDAVNQGFHLTRPDATYVFVGDIGPGGEAETQLAPASAGDAVRQANSPNHQGDGQNLLYGDGHVDFATTPFAGSHGDNVYTAGGPECASQWPATRKGPARLAASPADADDSILLPEASDLK